MNRIVGPASSAHQTNLLCFPVAQASCPGVSICIVVRNEEDRIERCLRALLSQDFTCFDAAIPIEIIVVDNQSSDRTVETVQKFQTQIDLRVVRLDSNNMGAARNRALHEAKYDFIAFTDADCEVPKLWVSALLSGLIQGRLRDPQLAAVGTGNRPPPGDPFYEALDVMFASFIGNLSSTQAKIFASDCEVSHLSTSSVMYVRSLLLEAGGFAPQFARVCEDVDASCRLGAKGFKLKMLAGREVEHRHSKSYVDWARKIYKYGWGQSFVLKRHRSYWSIRLMLPLVFVSGFVGSFAWGLDGLVAFLSVYFIFVSVWSMWLCLWKGRFDLWSRVTNLFVVTHFSYSAGMLVGFVNWFGGSNGSTSN